MNQRYKTDYNKHEGPKQVVSRLRGGPSYSAFWLSGEFFLSLSIFGLLSAEIKKKLFNQSLVHMQ